MKISMDKIEQIPVSNLDKIFWPDERITKGDLLKYYLEIAKYILPHLRDRPESLHRYPNGIYGKSFYHKNYTTAPDWMEQKLIFERTTQTNYLICNDLASLIYIINLGCIDLNPWLSRINSLDRPDYFVLDLDPVERPYDDVVRVALTIKDLCDEIGLSCYPKTSGATGMHIYIPTGARYSYHQVRNFAEIMANITFQRNPEISSIQRSTEKRRGKIYIDFLQNFAGQTLASAYSVRPVRGAAVSTPLFWDEIKQGLTPSVFTIFNIGARLEKIGDIFEPTLCESNDLDKAITRIKG